MGNINLPDNACGVVWFDGKWWDIMQGAVHSEIEPKQVLDAAHSYLGIKNPELKTMVAYHDSENYGGSVSSGSMNLGFLKSTLSSHISMLEADQDG